MSNSSPVHCRTIEDVPLPYPASKLIITQRLEASQESPFWAWIIVGAFYDRQDNVLWSTKIFAGRLDIDSDSGDESSDTSSVAESYTEETGSSDIFSSYQERSYHHNEALNYQVPPAHRVFPYWSQSPPYAIPPTWDPTTQGQVPGFWQASFDPNGQPYVPHLGGPGYNFGLASPVYGYMYPGTAAYGQPVYGFPPQGPVAGFQTQQTYAHQPNGTGNILPRQAQPIPQIDPKMPAAQMTNSSGGVGCEPGYNYFFPANHTKVHVFKSDIPPWQLQANAQIPFIASHVPTSTKLGDLLKGFGCTNPSAKKNICFELYSGGNGKWYKGYSFTGDDKDEIGKTMDEVGWDSSRTGNKGEKPVVCLWFCKS
ncbi:hypothetical protein QSH57_014177 [Fusarium oxysporum f. sp. vasinfectum]|nr:hypothetical protein QSH57_014177 [Fusarium oxysporum f. sp. vasinfectum]